MPSPLLTSAKAGLTSLFEVQGYGGSQATECVCVAVLGTGSVGGPRAGLEDRKAGGRSSVTVARTALPRGPFVGTWRAASGASLLLESEILYNRVLATSGNPGEGSQICKA